MNCGTCKHWNLDTTTLGAHGFGKCDARKEGALKAAMTTSAQCLCRLGKHQPAPIAVLREREEKGRELF